MTRPRLQAFLLWFNATQAVIWTVLIVPTVVFWSKSILWIALMSVWANLAGAIAGLTAALLSRQMDE